MTARFDVTDGLPDDWASLTASAPAPARGRWIRFGLSWFHGPWRTFALRADDGTCLAAMGGTVLDEPGPVGRRDPWFILSGRMAYMGLLAEDDPPWGDAEQDDVFPCLVLMYPYYATFPVGARAGDPDGLVDYLRAMVAWAGGQGVRSIALLFLTEDAALLLPALDRVGFTTVPLVERADLHVTWKDFEGYVESLPNKNRRHVRSEVRRTEERGLVAGSRRLDPDEPELLELRCELIAKYDGTADPAAEGRILELIREHVPREDTTVFTLTLDGTLVSYCLFIRDDDVWTAMLTGSRYSMPEASFGYFSTVYYQPAAAAPEAGIRTIAYGPATIDAKRRRGCTITPCYASELRLATGGAGAGVAAPPEGAAAGR